MKKTISFILVVIMWLALAACSNSRPDDGVKEIGDHPKICVNLRCGVE